MGCAPSRPRVRHGRWLNLVPRGLPFGYSIPSNSMSNTSIPCGAPGRRGTLCWVVVREIPRNPEARRLPDSHERQPFPPSRDDPLERERCRPSAPHGAVEHISVRRPATVVDGDLALRVRPRRVRISGCGEYPVSEARARSRGARRRRRDIGRHGRCGRANWISRSSMSNVRSPAGALPGSVGRHTRAPRGSTSAASRQRP